MHYQKQQTIITPTKEQILVVKRSKLFPHEGSSWHGLNTKCFDDFFQIVQNEHEFQSRPLMEEDPSYKQIIPYVVFRHNGTYFLMQRQEKASEQRLKNKYTLGIGGHIRKEDLSSNDIMGWAQREFHEEVTYTGDFTVTPLGILNDDSNAVGKVHIGFVLLIEGSSADISIKSELKNGQLISLEECQNYYTAMEGWSQTVFDTLKN